MRLRGWMALASLGIPLWVSACNDLLGSGGGGPPAVEAVTPADGETGVSVLSPIRLTFGKQINLESASEAVTLWNDARPVQVVPQLSSKGKVVVLQPMDPLDFGATYRVQVSTLLRFREGGTLAAPFSAEFKTEGLPPPVPNQDSLFLHLQVLAHDSMRGRWSGSGEERDAAEYLADRFTSYGLRAPSRGYFQNFQAFAGRQGRLLNSQNVLAAVEGAGALADEWIVVGAHYDHIGFRGLPDETQGPNNGADDNGSGAVLVLELARILQGYLDAGGTASRDRRSVLFAEFGAEEEGLLGSCSYVYEDPAVPLAQTKAMMNFDMVGRLREGALFLSGGETSDAWATLAANSNSPGLTINLSTSSCTGCTDHVCFWREGVPFLGFFTGYHAEYHTPGDDVGTINLQGMVQVGAFAVRALSRLLVMEEAPTLKSRYPTGL